MDRYRKRDRDVGDDGRDGRKSTRAPSA